MIPRIVAIVGTNASGKSDLAQCLAPAFDAEVISADSRQVYVGLDIGTGKVAPAERGEVPYHGIDLVRPGQRYTLWDFQHHAYDAIDQILAAGRLPMLVGGTGLYVRAVTEGYRLMPIPPDHEYRRHLESLPLPELHQLLDELDPQAARVLDRRNRRRIIRAVELARHGHTYDESHTQEPRYAALQLGLTWEPAVLRDRIGRRLDRRLQEGLVDEVEGLRKDGVSDQFLFDVGLEYRWVIRYLWGEYPSLDEMRDDLATAIHRFARRQMSWFAKDVVHWLDSSGDYEAEAAQLIEQFLARPATRRGPQPVRAERSSVAPPPSG
jgi:tRNA dimethylallyltransferase